MRVEPFAIGSYIHAIKRGARGMPITNNATDKDRFLKILYYMNEEYFDENWERDTASADGILFARPNWWPERKPLVHILAYTLMPNHAHLMLEEIRDGGVSMFMKKLAQSMTNHFNQKYKQKGSLFQGAYKSRTIQDDTYLRYVAAYIMVKNTCELYPRGKLRGAMEHFEDAWKWAVTYRFSSLGEYVGIRKTPILNNTFLAEVFGSPKRLKSFARDVLLGGKWLEGTTLE